MSRIGFILILVIAPSSWGAVTTCAQSGVKLGPQTTIHETVLNFDLQTHTDLVDVKETKGYINFAIESEETALNYLVRDKKYLLSQFHFHERQEHLLPGQSEVPSSNVELHFVHLAHDTKTAPAVVGVVIQGGGAEHAGMKALLELLAAYQDASAETDEEGEVDLPSFFPHDKSGFDYVGSLTAGAKPPFLQGVKWWVYKTPITISDVQMAALRATPKVLHTARPIQPCS